MKSFRIVVFGKSGCDKCALLNQRLDRLLKKKEWTDFEKVYFNSDNVEGLITFCQAECMNPQRIPAMLLTRRNKEGGYEPLLNPSPGKQDAACGKSRLYQYMGLQTDYTNAGKGLITPKMIESVLSEALEMAS